ncbi:hypothetical protein ANCDUO_09248 [Ancylostoma duodenale]|uniref:Uncharacterized protein n=1 Tax=Ancylostoma duodenale TaxID=51022 RepID=A0A0C2CUC2_9BILA|nr:hypothetical protein ANCDUO_09248 [Ancylostoma duodenale]
MDDRISLTGRIRIKIGHIGAQNALKNDVGVLEVSHKSLRQERILDDDFDVELPKSPISQHQIDVS